MQTTLETIRRKPWMLQIKFARLRFFAKRKNWGIFNLWLSVNPLKFFFQGLLGKGTISKYFENACLNAPTY